MYDIIIVGAGPAGLTAALYARRAERNVLVIEKDTFGGQITHSPRVENYPGFIEMSGNEFADKLLEQVMAQGAKIELDEVTSITGDAGNYTVHCVGKPFSARSVIIASGSHHRMLGLDGEHLFVGEGISYCAVCDGAFYKGKQVAVIGGGNSALQDAVLLSDIAESVTVVQNLAYLTGESRLQGVLNGKPNVKFIFSTVVREILSDDGVFKGIEIENTETRERSSLALDGMFVAIGQVPENEPFRNIAALDDYGYIEAGEDCIPAGSRGGIFVAGDCRTKRIRQITTATADGAVAALAAIRFLDNLKA